jgi:hypothetical protein
VVGALLTSPSVGIILGGLIGPLIGLALPAERAGEEQAPLGTTSSADRYLMPGAHVRDTDDPDGVP